jgi:hypothetical protein
MDVTKVCQDAVTSKAPITFNGTVDNTGTASLLNVTASDDHSGLLTLVGLTDVDGDGMVDDLAPGATATYSDQYFPTTFPTSTNTVTASGASFTPDGQTDLGVPHLLTATATCAVPPGQACTPGFWQGGLGSTLWNTNPDSDWVAHGATTANPPFKSSDDFNSYFSTAGDASHLAPFTMDQLVTAGAVDGVSGSDIARKAARFAIAAALNAEFGLDFEWSSAAEVQALWLTADNGAITFDDLFSQLAAAFKDKECTIVPIS